MSEQPRDMPGEPPTPSGEVQPFQFFEPRPPREALEPPHSVPERSFPAWTFWEVAAAGGSVVATVFLFSVVALLIAHGIPAYRNASMVALAGSPIVMIGSQVVAYPVVLGFMVFLVRSRTRQPFLESIHWNWPRLMGPAFFILGIVLAFSVELLSNLLPIPKSLPIDKFFNSPMTAYLMAAFGMTLAPLLEEMFFRGLLYPLLRRTMGVVAGIAVTGATFAAIHGAQLGYAWAPLLGIFVVGVVLTFVRERSDSVAASFLTHCGYNFALFAMLWIGSDHFRHLEKITS